MMRVYEEVACEYMTKKKKQGVSGRKSFIVEDELPEWVINFTIYVWKETFLHLPVCTVFAFLALWL